MTHFDKLFIYVLFLGDLHEFQEKGEILYLVPPFLLYRVTKYTAIFIDPFRIKYNVNTFFFPSFVSLQKNIQYIF